MLDVVDILKTSTLEPKIFLKRFKNIQYYHFGLLKNVHFRMQWIKTGLN